MAGNIVGKRMSKYTPLNEDDKEYFFGEGEGAVVTVGETSASSGTVNRLVKLSDIGGGGGGGVPNAGKGIEYDANTNTLSFYYNGSGGFTTELNSSNHEMMKVKAGVGIEVDNKGVSIDTQNANEGDVLTYHKNGSTDEVVWAAAPAGSTNIIGGSDGAIYGSGAYCYVKTDDSTIKVNSQNKLEANFSIIDGSGSVIDVMHGEGIHIGFDTNGATVGDVLTVDQYGAHWAAPQGGGGGGGLSPISPTTITPTLENNTYKIVIPGNNAYYIATINDTHDVEITPPTIGANEMYNVVLFIISNDFGDKQMTMAYGDYSISPLDDESRYGYVYGHGFTQFVFLGRGFTMKTSAYQAG